MSKFWKTVYDITAILFFVAITLVILIGAYATAQIDMWIVAALVVMILWKVYEKIRFRIKLKKELDNFPNNEHDDHI